MKETDQFIFQHIKINDALVEEKGLPKERKLTIEQKKRLETVRETVVFQEHQETIEQLKRFNFVRFRFAEELKDRNYAFPSVDTLRTHLPFKKIARAQVRKRGAD